MIKVTLHVLPNQDVEVRSADKTIVLECRPDAQKATVLLQDVVNEKINGLPIYSLMRVRGKFVIGPHLEELFNRYLRPYVMFLPVLDFLDQNSIIPSNVEDPKSEGLQEILSLLGYSNQVPPFKKLLWSFLRISSWFFLMLTWAFYMPFLVLGARFLGIKTILFSYDLVWGPKKLDRRLKDFYELLWSQKMPFLECFSSFSWSAIRNLIERRRFAFYPPPFTPLLTCIFPLSISIVPTESRAHRARLDLAVRRYFNNMQANDLIKSLGLELVLRLSGVRRAFSIDECWETTPLVLACEHAQIPLIALQHGQYSQYHHGIMQSVIPGEYTYSFPEIWIWGEETQRILISYRNPRLSGPTKICGYLRSLPEIRKRKFAKKDQISELVLLYGYEIVCDQKAVVNFLLSCVNSGVRIYFKTRWDAPIDSQIYGPIVDRVILVQEYSQELIDEIDFVVASTSSFIYELIYMGVPGIVLDTKLDYLASLAGDVPFSALISPTADSVNIEMLKMGRRLPPDSIFDRANFQFSL
jgi:hypothetical protein